MQCDNLAQVIMYMFPSAKPGIDFEVTNFGGDTIITKWSLTDPQPSEDVLLANSTAVQLNLAKLQKQNELQEKCNEAIAGGFKSSALGTVHTYPSHDKAQTNFNTEMHRFIIDPSYTSCSFFTVDAGFLTHTKDQFFKAFSDGHDYGNAQWDKLLGLLADVAKAKDIPSLDAITW